MWKFTKNIVGTKEHQNLYSNDDAREILAKIPDRCKFHMSKKMHHDNMNVHQKFHPNSCINEGARRINLLGHKSDLMWPSMTSEVPCHPKKKMRHNNVNVHQKFNPNSCVNEGARKINRPS